MSATFLFWPFFRMPLEMACPYVLGMISVRLLESKIMQGQGLNFLDVLSSHCSFLWMNQVPIRSGLVCVCFQSTTFWSQGKGEGRSCSGSHSQAGWMSLSWLPWQSCPGVGILAHICRAFLPMCAGSPQLQRSYWIESSVAFFTTSSLSHPWEVKWTGKIKWQEEISFMTLISWIYICS